MRQRLSGAGIFTGDETLDGYSLILDTDRILDIVPDATASEATEIRLPEGSLLAPGFIDAQVNGGGGVLFNDDPTEAGIARIVSAHRRFGTTGLLPTFITDAEAKMRLAIDAAARMAARRGSGVLGLHLEGPFINAARRGVHAEAFIRPLTPADRQFLCGVPAEFPTGRVLLSLAPEQVADDMIGALVASGFVVSAAHSAASYERGIAAVAAGVTGFTHLFNAMPPLVNRDPGIALAALLTPDSWCGVIADGAHVHPAMLSLTLAVKPRGRVYLVTDAMPPIGTMADRFELYGGTVERRDGKLLTLDGRLAGADLDMATAIRNCVTLFGFEREEALRMASLYPAMFLGLATERGRIAPGFIADLVLLDPTHAALGTWVAGEWQPAKHRT
jgi:N-acetylglucosamine-6-phosphate deacetylase